MKKRVIRMTMVMILLLLVIPLAASAMDVEQAEELTPIESYTYPITSDSPDWFNYTVLEKVEMLRIPEETLARMTDEALIQAIVDYPYFGDLGLYGPVENAVQTCRKYFSALDELMSRSTVQDSLRTYGMQVLESSAVTANAVHDDWRSALVVVEMQKLINYLCDDFSVEVQYDEEHEVYTTRAVVQTPNGSYVSVLRPEENCPSTYHPNKDAYAVSTYDVTLISGGTCKYNCHSYAWHSRSTSNPYWINDPAVYMSDGSYTRTYNGNPAQTYLGSGIQTGDIIYYGSGSHSAVVSSSNTTASSDPIAYTVCISKWGNAGVFRHALTEVPAEYITSSITAWRRA